MWRVVMTDIQSEKEYYNKIVETIKEFNSNGKKTIVYFCDVYYPAIDGVITVMNDYAKAMSKYYNVIVCVPQHYGQTTQSPDYLVIGAMSRYLKALEYSYSFHPQNDKVFCSLLDSANIDLIHIHSPFAMGRFGSIYAKKRGIPSVATFHSLYKQDFKMATRSRILTKILLSKIMRVFNNVDIVCTMNDFCIKTLKSYGLKNAVHIIPNGTNLPTTISNKESIDRIKQKYNLPNLPIMLSVGRLAKTKNLRLLIKIASKLNDNKFDFRLLIVGSGAMDKPLHAMVSKYKLTDKVMFLGRIADRAELANIFASADLFVFPSTYDTDGIVKTEAAIQGTPSIVTEGSGPASIIEDNYNGWVAKENEEDYAKKIIEIFRDKSNMEIVANNAKNTLVITKDQVAEKLKDFYESIFAEGITSLKDKIIRCD